jgi:hypothetical protein
MIDVTITEALPHSLRGVPLIAGSEEPLSAVGERSPATTS